MDLSQTTLAEQLLLFEDSGELAQFVHLHALEFGEPDLQAIKLEADHYLRANLARTQQLGNALIALADAGAGELARALGTTVLANAAGVSGIGDFGRAVDLYNEATRLYGELGLPRDQARAQIGKIYCLSHLSRFAEVEESTAWARAILEKEEDWIGLARLTANVGIVYGRKGDDVRGLALFNDARDYCLRAGPHPNSNLPNIEHNRSLCLRNLGHFDESIAASQLALHLFREAGSFIEAARSQQNLATTYFVLGRYNEALVDLDKARQTFLSDGRARDAVRVDLYISDCLLQLRRFGEVLDKCRQVREQMTAKGVQLEVAQAILNEAIAYAGLHRYDEAEAAVAEAKVIFIQEGAEDGAAYADLQQATLLYFSQKYTASVEMAIHCVTIFGEHEKPVESAYAHLFATRGLLASDQLDAARARVDSALALGEESMIPALAYQCHHLLGSIAAKRGEAVQALAHYDAAIDALEHLRGRLMLEFRAAYVEDKQAVYEDAVLLCIDAGRPAQALDYVERAKSRALLDLVAQHLELRVEARSAEDLPLLNELTELRSRRDQLYRLWEGSDDIRATPFVTRDGDYQQAQVAVAELEERITALWHTLLMRNADYARDAALWRTRSEPVQPLLNPDTLLLEYFVARDQYIVFLITRDHVEAIKLALDSEGLQQTLRLLRVNMATVPTTAGPQQLSHLEANARLILKRLYDELIRPIADRLAPYRHLIIVPHGPLHYLPFHALHTGNAYWLETVEISYLPSASFLHYCQSAAQNAQTKSKRLIAFGNSANGQLPYAVNEAVAVAQRMGGRAFVEGDATKANLIQQAPHAEILHLAAHADFRADNPLFCGLSLADGWLTTLDIFELKLPLALATLSACQTGRSVVGGGDELLGLIRAWISAGVASLLLSYWPVEDSSAATLMEHFYGELAAGQGKATALRAAQLALFQNGQLPHAHPYFWAAYFLVGDFGRL